MYNLFVSAHENDWEGEPFFLEINRFCEYTDTQLSNKYSDLNQENMNEIMRYPCLFTYERFLKKNPQFGLIREIVKRQGKVKITYEFIDLDKSITFSDIENHLFDLDIDNMEMNRTHWAIKEVNLSKELNKLGITLPKGISRDSKAVDISKHQFDVALSFPGEVREYVEKIVDELEQEVGPNSYFYDNNYKAQLARPNLDTLLQDIYGNRSKLIVIFLCQKYNEKDWCGIEYRAIREILKKKENSRIMLIKMDDGKVDGVFEIDGYIDSRRHNAREITNFIKERIDLLS
ncbi:MAG TPA: TIR domain-containing protein [Candidatus Woesebacteria bacterium]|nr:TIR domain-containing protein [Candidatus Woesebacteria bacterium]